MKYSTLFSIVIILASSAVAMAQNQREIAVRNDKDQIEADGTWIYNDLDRGFETAQSTGKPLLVLLRCIP